jgi:hypothetical protein
MIKTWDYLEEFCGALLARLQEDERRWGDTWLQRPPEGQEGRIEEHIKTYFDQFRNAGVPVPWMKIAGLALIGWVRESHPELWDKRGGSALAAEEGKHG